MRERTWDRGGAMAPVQYLATALIKREKDNKLNLKKRPMPISIMLVGCWLVVFNVPSTARSFRDGTPIYCPLRRT